MIYHRHTIRMKNRCVQEGKGESINGRADASLEKHPWVNVDQPTFAESTRYGILDDIIKFVWRTIPSVLRSIFPQMVGTRNHLPYSPVSAVYIKVMALTSIEAITYPTLE